MNRPNIVILLLAGLLFAAVAYLTQPQTRWVPTFSALDKEPYGGYVTHRLMKDLFPGQEIRSAYRTVYEMTRSDTALHGSILITSTLFNPDKEDWTALIEYVSEGNNALIASNNMAWDSLKTKTADLELEGKITFENQKAAVTGTSVVSLKYQRKGFPQQNFSVPAEASSHYFEVDTTGWESLAVNEAGQPVLIRFPVGEGSLYLSSTPLLLTNYFVLNDSLNPFSAGLLSLLPKKEPLTHIEYYQVGRLESQTPLRFIFTSPALTWAYFLALFTLVLFMLFEAKRRQRIIPVQKPLVNTSLDFVRTLGQLYYTAGNDHRNLALKRINYLADTIRRKYHLPISDHSEGTLEEISRRSGKSIEDVRRLFATVERARHHNITGKELLEMEGFLSRFYQPDQYNPEKK